MEVLNVFSAENIEGRVDVARALGSTATLMFIYDLGPGQSSCPYHYEYEEEWLLVVDGTIVVRTPDGEHSLERGNLVCFPSGPAGAHKLMNRSESPAQDVDVLELAGAGRRRLSGQRQGRRVRRREQATCSSSAARRCRGPRAKRAGRAPTDAWVVRPGERRAYETGLTPVTVVPRAPNFSALRRVSSNVDRA